MGAKVAVIGAGCSGITAIKNLKEVGIKHIVAYEQNGQVGGNWIFSAKESHSSVCETTHIISSKKLSAYRDFPMPKEYPDYPSHEQVLAYFQAYAKKFGVEQHIRFKTKVASIKPTEDQKWAVTTETGDREVYDYVLVANGHHSVPRHPDLPGTFTGEYLHSHRYKTNRPFAGKRVLVIGAGNSGCDCAVEISRVAERVAISIRSPQYIIPKFMLGKPTDTFNATMQWIPRFIADPLRKLSLKLNVGRYEDYGLETPPFPVTKIHPTLNSELLYKIRHGKVHPRKGVQSIDGQAVTFTDGKQETFDTIIAATGYKISFPFLDSQMVNYEDAERIPLYLRMFHPEYPGLIFIGLVQPQGAVWPLSDYQSLLAAKYIKGTYQLPEDLTEKAEQEADQIASDFHTAKRHAVEVHYHPFLRKLKKEAHV
ncbi:MAG TPA: NAD(P)-binding domain-containing protein [Saprospiraceae bacterium]|nr:NAD(P)-binding domain-containing protein [Saprospiraceae bacterium]